MRHSAATRLLGSIQRQCPLTAVACVLAVLDDVDAPASELTTAALILAGAAEAAKVRGLDNLRRNLRKAQRMVQLYAFAAKDREDFVMTLH